MSDDTGPDFGVKHHRVVGLAATLGFSTVASLVVCIVGGLLLDQWLDTTPWFTLGGVALGLIAAGYQLWELILVSDSNRRSGPLGRTMAQRMQKRERNKIQ